MQSRKEIETLGTFLTKLKFRSENNEMYFSQWFLDSLFTACKCDFKVSTARLRRLVQMVKYVGKLQKCGRLKPGNPSSLS